MVDGFLILTPLLLLPVIALLGFAGCVSPSGYIQVVDVHTAVKSAPTGASTVTAGSFNVGGYLFLVATLQWGSPLPQPTTPTLTISTGDTLTPVDGGGPYD